MTSKSIQILTGVLLIAGAVGFGELGCGGSNGRGGFTMSVLGRVERQLKTTRS